MPRPTKAVIALCALLALGACAPEKPEASLAKAKEALARDESNEAVVLLKDVLQREPQLVEARLLLGKTLLETGDPVGALAQLDKAIEQGAPAAPLALPRARAQLLQGKYKIAEEALDTLSPDSKIEEAERLYLLGLVHTGLSRLKAAEASIRASLDLNPDSAEARLMLARVVLSQGRIEEGQTQLSGFQAPKAMEPQRRFLVAVAKAASNAPAEEIRKAFEAVLEAAPQSAEALSGLAALHLREGDLRAAKVRIGDLKRFHPKDLRGVLLQASLDANEQRIEAASQGVATVLKLMPNDLAALSLAGQIAVHERDWTMAETHFGKALSLQPDSLGLRAMLGRVQLNAGHSDKALSTVLPRIQGGQATPELLAVAATAMLERGQPAEASALFAKALASKQSTDERLQIALLQSRLGVGDQGATVLAPLSDDTKRGVIALTEVISRQIRDGQLDEALESARKLERAQPERALPHHLQGQILLSMGRRDAARTTLETALKKQPDFLPSLHMLASLEVSEGVALSAAEKRFEAILSRQPRHVEARLALATLAMRSGDEALALRRLEGLRSDVPGNLGVHTALISHHAALGRFNLAEQAAEAALKALPEEPNLLDLLGRAQFTAGRFDAALQTFTRLAKVQPRSPTAILRQADALVATKKFKEAGERLADAERLAPRDADVQRALVMLPFSAGNVDEAISRARALQAKEASRIQGLILEGDLDYARSRWASASKAYRRTLELAPSLAEAAIKTHQCLMAMQSPEADSFAQQWGARNPGALPFHVHLGTSYASLGQYVKAEAAFSRALAIRPDSVEFANNVAWARMKSGRTDGLPLIRSAVARDALNAQAHDTLAGTLALKGDHAEALSVQRRAVRLAPQNVELRLHLVDLLIRGKQLSEAAQELKQISLSAVPAPLKAEHERLASLVSPG